MCENAMNTLCLVLWLGFFDYYTWNTIFSLNPMDGRKWDFKCLDGSWFELVTKKWFIKLEIEFHGLQVLLIKLLITLDKISHHCRIL